MTYRFEAEIQSGKGKLSREDRHEIGQYLALIRVEADDAMKAYRSLAKKVAGRLSKESSPEEAVIALPDYGSSCSVRVRAYAEDSSGY